MSASESLSISDRANIAIDFIRKLLPEPLRNPKVAVICGSGLQHLAHALSDTPRVEIKFADIPYFPQTTGKYNCSCIGDGCHSGTNEAIIMNSVEGHTGKLVFGYFGDVPSVCMVGRVQ